MTASETLSRTASHHLRPVLAFCGGLSLLLLAGCGGANEVSQQPPPEQAPPASQDAAEDDQPSTPVSTTSPAGFSPLPTRQQVVGSVPVGTRDPFRRLPQPRVRPTQAAGAAASIAPPSDFRFTGVLSSGSSHEAVVQFGSLSGTLRQGDRGGRNTDLLPPGWQVASVDVQRGRLQLVNSGQKVTFDL